MSAISSIGFTAGGIDVNSIVTSLMTAERASETLLTARRAAVTAQSTALARLQASLLTLQNQAGSLVSTGITKLSSTVSAPGVVSASVSSTAQPGWLSFTVDALARANGIRTVNTVASSTAVVTTASSLAVSSTANRLGIASMQVGAGVTTGQYKVTVTQATAGASQTGTAALGASTVIDATNNTLLLQIDGVARSLTLAGGTYTASGLATAVQTALDAAGGGAKASIDGAGRLNITTTHEGSTATLQIVGGNATTPLNLAAGSSTGTDGAVQIGSNPSVAVTSAGTGATVAVSTGLGALTLRLDGGLRVGDAAVAVVSTGDRSLSAVASAINGANVGVSAAAVNTSPGAWLLQMTSAGSGTANKLSIDSSAFSGVGGLVETAAAQDAKITIGSGAGAYSVISSTNVFSDVLPGVALTVAATSSSPVTVSVGRDDAATADAVGGLVTAANALLADIAAQTKYDTTTNTAAPLSGDSTVRRMADQIRAAVTAMVGTGSTSLAGTVGIAVQKDGSLAFDRNAFITALGKDPAGVARLFSRGGTSVAGATWAAATDNTAAGSYAVTVTTAATRATSGDVLIGGSAGGQTIGVRVGSTTASYHALAGATPADIVAGLNASLAAAGLKINAQASGGGVRLTAVGFGGAGSFDTNLDVGGPGSAWTANTGTDVVGTIAGRPAIGVGNRLSLLDGDTSPARGLALTVGEGLTGTLGPVDYQPGIAARLSALATALTGKTGALTTAANGYSARIAAFNAQIDQFEIRMTAKEAQYRRQWTVVQSSLSTLQNQGSWLSTQLSSLSPQSK